MDVFVRLEAEKVNWYTEVAKAAEESASRAFSEALWRLRSVEEHFGDNWGTVSSEVEAVMFDCLLDAISRGGGPEEVAGKWSIKRKS